MSRFLNWSVDRPRLSATLALLLTFAFGTGIAFLDIDASTSSLFSTDDPEVVYYQNVRANFGDDTVITIVVKSPDVFDRDILAAIDRMTRECRAIDGVSRVVSLFTVDVITSKGKRPLLDSVPADPAEIETARAHALADPLLDRLLIDQSATVTVIHLFLRSQPDEPLADRRIAEAVKQIVEEVSGGLPDGTAIHPHGVAFLKAAVSDYVWKDLLYLGPLALLVIGAVLLAFFRSLVAVILPVITGVLSVIATLGFMGHAGFELNPLTSIVPVLILVIGCTEDIHLIAEYSLSLQSGLVRERAIRSMLRFCGAAIFMTALTTALSFLSIAPSSVVGLRQFAISCAVGITLNFFITVLLVPAVLTFFPPTNSLGRKPGRRTRRLIAFVAHSLRHRRPAIVLGAATLFVLSAIGLSRLQIDTDYGRFFKPDSEVRRNQRIAGNSLAGTGEFMVVIETGRENGVHEPGFLKQTAVFNDFLDTRFNRAIGYADLIRHIHAAIGPAGVPNSGPFPDSGKTIAFYSLLFDPSFLRRFVDYDASRTVIHVRSSVLKSSESLKAKAEVLEFARQNLPPGLEVHFTGETALIHNFSDRISRQLITNLAFLVLVVTAIIALAFRSLRIALVAIVSNSLPIVATIGFMGWIGIPLSTATFPVALVAFGIAIDDTIHFIARYRSESVGRNDPNRAITRAVFKEFRPIACTSTALGLGYLVLLYSDFNVNRDSGILFALAFAVAFATDMLVTPVLIYATARSRKS